MHVTTDNKLIFLSVKEKNMPFDDPELSAVFLNKRNRLFDSFYFNRTQLNITVRKMLLIFCVKV